MRWRTITAVTVAVVLIFFFLPVFPVVGISPLRGEETGWVSPSFALFQCGSFTGFVFIEVSNGAVVGVAAPFWLSSANWNCQFPHVVR